MNEDLLLTLLEDVKNALRITWDDEDKDIKKKIEGAVAYLNGLCGTSFDFSIEGDPKTLLLERCRYVYNNAAHEFEINYRQELARLILDIAVQKASETSEITS